MRSKRLAVLLLLLLSFQSSGCGTLMFKERSGQKDGHIDPNVVVMDSLCLLLFVVPGILAYAIDFSTGAIYLPPDAMLGEGPFFRDEPAKTEEEGEAPVQGPEEKAD